MRIVRRIDDVEPKALPLADRRCARFRSSQTISRSLNPSWPASSRLLAAGSSLPPWLRRWLLGCSLARLAAAPWRLALLRLAAWPASGFSATSPSSTAPLAASLARLLVLGGSLGLPWRAPSSPSACRHAHGRARSRDRGHGLPRSRGRPRAASRVTLRSVISALLEQEVDDLVLVQRRAQLGGGHRLLLDVLDEALAVLALILLRGLRDQPASFPAR